MTVQKPAGSTGMPVWATTLYLLLVGMYLFPIWLLNFFPTVDGPVHIYNADLILKMFSGEWPLHAHFFEFNKSPDPNWFLHLLLAGLVYVSNVLIAEKLLLSLYVVLFSLGIIYAIRGVNRDGWPVAFLALPFVTSFIFHFGFFSFTFSLATSFFIFGFWMRHGEQLKGWRITGFSILLLLLYLFHVVVYIATMMALGVLVMSAALISWKKTATEIPFAHLWWELAKEKLIPVAIAALPSLILFLAFFLGRDVIIEPSNGPLIRALHLVGLPQLVSFDLREAVFSVSLGLIIFGSVGWLLLQKYREQNFVANDALIVSFIAVLLLYLLTPDTLVTSPGGIPGGGLMELRLSYTPLFVLLLWLASVSLSERFRKLFVLGGSLVTVGFFVMHFLVYQKIDLMMSEYLSAADKIEPQAVVMTLRAGHLKTNHEEQVISSRFDIFTHAGNRLALSRNAVNIQNLEAMVGYFPIRFKPGYNPFVTQGRLDGIAPMIRLSDYEEVTGKTIDYVSFWGGTAAPDIAEQERLTLELKNNYEKIFTSSHGYLDLYQRR